jgi:hypothetical protein
MTAVEWFLDQIQQKLYIRDNVIKQALEMEKEQIINAHGIKTKSINQDQSEIITGSQYYDETFKNK